VTVLSELAGVAETEINPLSMLLESRGAVMTASPPTVLSLSIQTALLIRVNRWPADADFVLNLTR
jgi:hypothetical protein